MDITKFHEYRLFIQIRLIYDTGIRGTESCELETNDIDFKFNSLLIRNPKNNKERFVYFSRKMSSELKRWLKYREDLAIVITYSQQLKERNLKSLIMLLSILSKKLRYSKVY